MDSADYTIIGVKMICVYCGEEKATEIIPSPNGDDKDWKYDYFVNLVREKPNNFNCGMKVNI